MTNVQSTYDETGDLFIGRFCVDNNLQIGLTELHNVVNKTIYYESEATFGGWRDETGVLVHEDFTYYMPPFFHFIINLVPTSFTVNTIDASQPNTHENIYQVMNDGIIIFTYYGHGVQHGWSAGGYLDLSILEANLTNSGKPPIVNGIACETGWFDAPGDCFGESLVTYSGNEGFTGYLGAGRSVYSHAGSTINNPPERFQELLQYTIFHDLSHITGEYILESKAMYPSSGGGQYKYAFNFFGDPALNVMAQGFQVTQDVELPETTVISNEITVTNGAVLTIPVGGQLRFEANGGLIIDESATLIISDNAVLESLNSNDLVVEGNLTIGDNVTFTASDADWDVYLNNTGLETVLVDATFENCRLHNYGKSLTITNCIFDDCFMVDSHRGNVTVANNTSFNRTWLYLENTEDNNNTATVSHCSFTTDVTMAAIDMWNYNQYDISNNTIFGYYNGIQIVQSGYGLTKKQTIQDNTITNCSQKGILAYNTLGSVYRNHISNNNFGVWIGDHSGMKLYGNSGAVNNNQTQEICNNASYEVYASQYSFPVYFRYNVIIDEDNTGAPDDPLVYYSAGSGDNNLRDVSRNCWGQNFNASEDLYPSGYVWMPTWCPGIGDSNNPPADEDMYEVASSLFENENYVGAKSVYEMLIDEYPESKFAKAALQELFALEKFVSDDYSSLKQYYATNSTIQSDSILGKTAHHLASKCDVKTENWADAISYYENIILNPETMEDSIFAIIDLGYVYFVMENSGYKSAYSDQLTQYKPETKDQFIKNRDYLLSLLPGDQKSKTINDNVAGLKEGELMQNEPNPFSSTTQIAFDLNTECDVKISITDYTGKSVKNINVGVKEKGIHSITFSAQNFNPGLYFYTLITDGIPTETRKMIILK